MLVFDTWRNDMMNTKVTPAITRLAAQGSIFPRHYSGSNNTRHGLFSLFYGLPGHYWQAVLNVQKSPVLIDVLQQQAYQIGIFSSAKLTSPEFDQTIFSAIQPLRRRSEGRTPSERDLDTTRDFSSWYQNKNKKRPYFAFLFYDAAHGLSVPKDYPKVFQPSLDYANYMALDDDYDPRALLNLYKNAVHYLDQQVAQILRLVNKDLANTIIIITGDHGREFNDNGKGYWGHNSNYSDYQTRVPLVIYWPGYRDNFFSGETSHYDIAPTLLSGALGCENAAWDYSVGQSLFDKNSQDYIIFGRSGNYAIKIGEQLNEIDRFGNFSIYDSQYRELQDAKLKTSQTLMALEDLRRFYKQ
ncbi:sulfatase-like hydrolase/transferase [Thalassomonas viridans]|nr:sulfatase-like hydrolase/transferase [Thalassomonas viridans]